MASIWSAIIIEVPSHIKTGWMKSISIVCLSYLPSNFWSTYRALHQNKVWPIRCCIIFSLHVQAMAVSSRWPPPVKHHCSLWLIHGSVLDEGHTQGSIYITIVNNLTFHHLEGGWCGCCCKKETRGGNGLCQNLKIVSVMYQQYILNCIKL